MAKKKILIVTSEFPPQPGGIGNHAFELAKQLDFNDYEVRVLADMRSHDQSEADFDNSLSFRVIRVHLRKVRFFMYLDRIVKALRHIKRADVIIASGKFSIWNVAFCRCFIERKTLVVMHGSEVNSRQSMVRFAINQSLKQFDTIVAVSQYTKTLVKHLNKTVHVIPNGVNYSFWNQPLTESLILKGNPALTTVGRVSERKGQLEVIKLLPELIGEFPELHYHCIGIPMDANLFLEEAKRLHVSEYVTFHGIVTDHVLKQLLKATDIFVMMSKTSVSGDVEGFGIAIIEANALGIPAIGSTGCGIEDAIKDGYSGFLVDLNDSKAFKVCITNILNDNDGYSKRAKQWAKMHDWSEVIKHYEALI